MNGTPFATWFGDSKVVDSAGAPLVVFHGTVVQGPTYDTPSGHLPRGAFTAFDKRRRGWVTESSDAKVGFWFSADEQRAASAASDAKACSEDCGVSAYVYEVFLSIRNPLVIDSIRETDPAEIARLVRSARRRGHDGVIFTEGEGQGADYLVFEPEQIKSATANSGLFDSQSADMTDAHGFGAEGCRPMERMRA